MTMPSPVLKETTSVWAKSHGPAAPKLPTPPVDAGAAPPSPLPDLAAFTDEALAALVEQGRAELTRRKEKKEADFLALVSDTAKVLGLSPARVAAAISGRSARHRVSAGSTDGRHEVKPVYRDPATGATWSGRGPAPPFIEFGDEVNPKTGKPLPLRKFWIAEQEK